MHASEPRRRQRMRFIGMHNVEFVFGKQFAKQQRCARSLRSRSYFVYLNACLSRPPRQRRIANRHQLRTMPALEHSLRRKQRLILPAAPFHFQIHNQRNHSGKLR